MTFQHRSSLDLLKHEGAFRDKVKQKQVHVDARLEQHQDLTALAFAASTGKLDLAQWLVEQKANVNAAQCDPWASTPLHLAAAQGHVQMCRLLLQHKADLAATTSDGMNALHTAAEVGEAACVALLLDCKADARVRNKITNRTALDEARDYEHDACVALLGESG